MLQNFNLFSYKILIKNNYLFMSFSKLTLRVSKNYLQISNYTAGQVKYLKYLNVSNVSRNIYKMFQALEIFELYENISFY